MKTALWIFIFSFIMASTLSYVTTAHAGERIEGLLPLSASLLNQIEDTARPPHSPRVSPGQLNLSVPFEPIRETFEQIKSAFNLPGLRNRGEAHITVITPPEFSAAFASVFSPQQVMQIMRDAGLDQSQFEAICLGRVAAPIQGQTEQAFFVLVDSPDLIKIRETLRDRLAAAGGNVSHFDPSDFHPHITVGFTLRDLQESDNIVKDIHACAP